MSGLSQCRWIPAILLACALISAPAPLPAQTAQELARQQELLQRIQEQELRQREMEQALRLRAEEQQLRQMHLHQEQETRQREFAKVQEAMFRAQMEQGEAAAQYQEARRLYAEASAAGQESNREREARLQEVEERLKEYQVRRLDRSDEVRARTQEAMVRAEQEAKKYQEIVVRMQSRVRLGVELSMDQGEEFDTQGVRVAGIIEDSPAEAIGLEEGDIITHLAGHSLLDPIPDEADQDFDLDISIPIQRLQALVGELDPGDEMDIGYLRDGQARSATFEAADVKSPAISVYTRGEGPASPRSYWVGPDSTMEWHFTTPDQEFYFRGDDLVELKELEQLKELEGLNEFTVRIPEFDFQDLETDHRGVYMFDEGEGTSAFSILRRAGRYGLELTDLNPELGEYFSTNEGILVLNVDEDSELGLRPGDVILSIGDRAVEDQGDVGRILASYEDDETVTFRIMRSGSQTQNEGRVR